MFEYSMTGMLGALPMLRKGRSRAINAENPTGEKGKGGMASGPLGPSRKGSPCLKDIQPGESVVLGEVKGAGMINHIVLYRGADCTCKPACQPNPGIFLPD